MRAAGHDFKWLIVCQVYFIIWGTILATGFTFYGYKLYAKASSLVKAKSDGKVSDLQIYLNRIMTKQVRRIWKQRTGVSVLDIESYII